MHEYAIPILLYIVIIKLNQNRGPYTIKEMMKVNISCCRKAICGM